MVVDTKSGGGSARAAASEKKCRRNAKKCGVRRSGISGFHRISKPGFAGRILQHVHFFLFFEDDDDRFWITKGIQSLEYCSLFSQGLF